MWGLSDSLFSAVKIKMFFVLLFKVRDLILQNKRTLNYFLGIRNIEDILTVSGQNQNVPSDVTKIHNKSQSC